MHRPPPPAQLWLIYDGDCRFCRACVGWIERRDRAGKLHPVPYQEASNPPLMPQMLARAKHSVLVIAPDGRVHTAGRAVLFVLAEIGWAPWLTRLAARPPLIWAVELGYRIVAENRGRISRVLFRKRCAGCKG